MTGTELILSDLPRVLLEASILLSIAVLVGLLIRATHIPLTVVLAVAGLVVNESGADLEPICPGTPACTGSSSDSCRPRWVRISSRSRTSK